MYLLVTYFIPRPNSDDTTDTDEQYNIKLNIYPYWSVIKKIKHDFGLNSYLFSNQRFYLPIQKWHSKKNGLMINTHLMLTNLVNFHLIVTKRRRCPCDNRKDYMTLPLPTILFIGAHEKSAFPPAPHFLEACSARPINAAVTLVKFIFLRFLLVLWQCVCSDRCV